MGISIENSWKEQFNTVLTAGRVESTIKNLSLSKMVISELTFTVFTVL